MKIVNEFKPLSFDKLQIWYLAGKIKFGFCSKNYAKLIFTFKLYNLLKTAFPGKQNTTRVKQNIILGIDLYTNM